MIHPDDREAVLRAAEEAMACDRVVDVEARYRHVDGSYRNLCTRRVAERDEQGRVIALSGVTIDMTKFIAERERAQAFVQRIDRVTNAAGVGIWSVDTQTHTVEWNEQMFRLYGLQRAEPPPDNNRWLNQLCTPKTGRLCWAAMIWRLASTSTSPTCSAPRPTCTRCRSAPAWPLSRLAWALGSATCAPAAPSGRRSKATRRVPGATVTPTITSSAWCFPMARSAGWPRAAWLSATRMATLSECLASPGTSPSTAAPSRPCATRPPPSRPARPRASFSPA